MTTAAETTDTIDATPILHRRTPLPSPREWTGLAGVIGVCAIAAAVVAVSLVQGPSTEMPDGYERVVAFHQSPSGLLVFVVIPLALFATVVIHEAGHVLAGIAVGFRFYSMQVGRIQMRRSMKFRRLSRFGGNSSGSALMIPRSSDGLAWREIVMIAGGPAANFLTALLILGSRAAQSEFAMVGFLGVVAGVSNLIPFQRGLVRSDGLRILDSLRRGRHDEGYFALMTVMGQFQDGVLPESFDPSQVRLALEAGNRRPDAALSGNYLAYWRAAWMDQGDLASRHLECCLALWPRLPAPVRQLLAAEAVFQTAGRAQRDLAESWRDDLLSLSPPDELSLAADAALRTASGDIAGALAIIDQLKRRAVSALDDPMQRRDAILFDRWRARVAASASAG